MLIFFCVRTFASVESWYMSWLNVRCFYTLLRGRRTTPWGLLKKKEIFKFLNFFLFWHFSFHSSSLVWRDTIRIADEDLGKINSLLLLFLGSRRGGSLFSLVNSDSSNSISLTSSCESTFMKVSFAYHSCMYLIRNTVKIVILWNITI